MIVLSYLSMINGVVLVFNLVPAFPLDGGRVLRSIIWKATGSLRKATYWAAAAGNIFAGLLMALGILQFFVGNWLGGIWLALIGLFLHNAAGASYQQVLLRQALRGEAVRRFMSPEAIVVPVSLDLLQWADDYVYRYDCKTFPVVEDNRLRVHRDQRA